MEQDKNTEAIVITAFQKTATQTGRRRKRKSAEYLSQPKPNGRERSEGRPAAGRCWPHICVKYRRI